MLTLVGGAALMTPARATGGGAALSARVQCQQGTVEVVGTSFGSLSSGMLEVMYVDGGDVFEFPWKYAPGGPDSQVIATIPVKTMIVQAGHQPPIDFWILVKEDESISVDDTMDCGAVSPSPTPTPTPTSSPTSSPTASPTPAGGVGEATATPPPLGGVGGAVLPNTGTHVPFELGFGLIGLGLATLVGSAWLMGRRSA
jgi:hypothetical protein